MMTNTATNGANNMTNQEINEMARNLEVGNKIFYTGDMANCSAFGVIAKVTLDEWGLAYDIRYENDEGDESRRDTIRLPACNFTAGPGQRFKTMKQYDAETNAAMARLHAARTKVSS